MRRLLRRRSLCRGPKNRKIRRGAGTRGHGLDLAPGLYVTATPIGNARDISLRALDVLKGCDAIVAEDTRVTAKLLAIYGISKPLSAYNDHNAARERPRLLARLRQGARLALVSDAGTPLVSDPGFKLVRAALAEDLPVHAIPGASAPLTGLALAGLPTDRFLFAGFLPPKQGERRSTLEELKGLRATLIFFESAQRLADTLADMAAVLGPREAAVGARTDQAARGDAARRSGGTGRPLCRGRAAAAARSRCWSARRRTPSPISAAPMACWNRRSPSCRCAPAADLVAEALGLPRRAVYARALALKPDHG